MIPLTPRQQEVGDLVARGMNRRQMAEKLGISPNTVKQHVEALYIKTGAANRVELALALLRTL